MKRLYAMCVILLAGCSAIEDSHIKPDDPDFAPVPAMSLTAPAITDGSLYQANYSMALYSDQRARRIGDVITVSLDEKMAAKKSNSANTSRKTSANLPTPTVLGSQYPFFDTSVSSDSAFNGTGKADQSNSLTGQITVTISDIMPNGILEVRGEKWIKLNTGDEYIRVRGLVRPQDISPDNTVLSSKLADARISYGGKGGVHDSAKQGWLSELFNSAWWPF
ncbi:MAG: flagellar basal body L-ring protein FlgH [Oceanospirillaceae bacterium]|nr:flagellar basal body L-ring protein FlgH [Oceanospirillaceae bacterium]MCP5350129.1 flagellar basal body L-ring protein FlgH [Oceanospirillaceae bacterium]